jgi:type VI secretion system protein ImpA
MASPPLLNFDEFMKPIPGDDPAGPKPREVWDRLKELRRENLEETPPKKSNWEGVVQLSEDTLKETSKDFQVWAYLTEALTKLHSFAGLRDGFQLARMMSEQCWDRINPKIEDGDLEPRASPFNWLDDPDRGSRFPNVLRQLPVIKGGEAGFYNWMDWKRSTEGKGSPTAADLEKAIQTTPYEFCQNISEDLTQCREEFQKLNQILSSKMGAQAPGFMGLGQSLEDCFGLVQQVLQKKGPPPTVPGADDAPAATADGAPAAGPPAASAKIPESREEAYRQLTRAASLLQKIEPHSPIPYLVQKAVELGALPFPELMRKLIRNMDVLEEMNRELGIKGPEES